MDFKKYKELVSSLAIGKQLPDAIYVHKSLLKELPTTLEALGTKIAEAFEIKPSHWNIVKFQKRDFKLSYLNCRSSDLI